MPAAEAPADAAGEPAEAAEDPKDAADSAEETAEDADAAEDAETPESPEIAIARPDAAQPAVQPGIAAPAIQPGGISVMLPGETRQVALNTQASNEDGTVMGDFETVVKNAKAGQEIILQEDYTGSLTIFDWIRLNLNKKTVTGTITVDLSGKKADGSRGTVEIVNGTITGGTESGVKITGAEGSEILLKDLTITDNSGKYGGGVYAKNSSNVKIDHCTISDNHADQMGGGIYAEDSSLAVVDSTVISNTSSRSGGGIYVKSGTLTAANNQIIGNTASTPGSSGGGIHLDGSSAELTNNTISKNTVSGKGGGLSSTDASGSANVKITLKGNTITENTATSNGGGLSINNKDQAITLDGDTIEGNEGGSQGGGIHVSSGSSLTMNGGSVSRNHAASGGGIYHASPDCTVELNGVALTENTANSGAGIYLNASRAKLVLGSGTLISGNKALYNGGGVYSYGHSTVIDLLLSTLYNNHAGTAGDDLYLQERWADRDTTLILRPVGDDWTLDDCGHTIDGWYIDNKDQRWNADATVDKDGNAIPKFIFALDGKLGTTSVIDHGDGTFTVTTTDGTYTVQKFEDGHYEVHITNAAPLALKAAHAVIPPEPTPRPGADAGPESHA